jgi:hypothetical protein
MVAKEGRGGTLCAQQSDHITSADSAVDPFVVVVVALGCGPEWPTTRAPDSSPCRCYVAPVPGEAVTSESSSQ